MHESMVLTRGWSDLRSRDHIWNARKMYTACKRFMYENEYFILLVDVWMVLSDKLGTCRVAMYALSYQQ